MGEPDRGQPDRGAQGWPATSLATWMDARLEDVDAVLALRVRSAVRDVAPETTLLDAPRALIAAAVGRLGVLATDGCVARDDALELLAVDALVTLACEVLADTCTNADEIAEAATAMVHAIGATMPTSGDAA